MSEEIKDTNKLELPNIQPEVADNPPIQLQLKGIKAQNLVHYAAHCGVAPDAHADWALADETVASLKVGQSVEIRAKNKIRVVVVKRIRGAYVWDYFVLSKSCQKHDLVTKDTKEKLHRMFTVVKIDGACKVYDVPGYILYSHLRTPYGREACNALPTEGKSHTRVNQQMVQGIIERGFVGGAAELLESFLGDQSAMQQALIVLSHRCCQYSKPEEPTIDSLKKRIFPDKSGHYLDGNALAPKERVRAGLGYFGASGTLDTIDRTGPLSLRTSRGVNHTFASQEALDNAILGLKTRGPVSSPWGSCIYDGSFLHIGCHRFLLDKFIATLEGKPYKDKKEDLSAEQYDRELASMVYQQSYTYCCATNLDRTYTRGSVTIDLEVYLKFFELPYTVAEWKALESDKVRQNKLNEKRTEWHGLYKQRQYITAVTRARRDWQENKDKYIASAINKYTEDMRLYVNQGESAKWYKTILKGAMSLNVNIASRLCKDTQA